MERLWGVSAIMERPWKEVSIIERAWKEASVEFFLGVPARSANTLSKYAIFSFTLPITGASWSSFGVGGRSPVERHFARPPGERAAGEVTPGSWRKAGRVKELVLFSALGLPMGRGNGAELAGAAGAGGCEGWR